MNATHIKSGHAGEVQDIHSDGDLIRYYFEDHARPSVAGWYYSSELIIPGVNS